METQYIHGTKTMLPADLPHHFALKRYMEKGNPGKMSEVY